MSYDVSMSPSELVQWEKRAADGTLLASSVPCGHCGGPVYGSAYDLKKRRGRSADGLLFCNRVCRSAKRRGRCSVCQRLDNLVLGFCSMHYKRAARNGDPMVKQRHRGVDDGAAVLGQGVGLLLPQQRPSGLEPAEVAVLLELADGQARSVGLIADITAYSIRTVRESVYRLRRKYGADAIEIVQYKPTLKFRLKEPIPLA